MLVRAAKTYLCFEKQPLYETKNNIIIPKSNILFDKSSKCNCKSFTIKRARSYLVIVPSSLLQLIVYSCGLVKAFPFQAWYRGARIPMIPLSYPPGTGISSNGFTICECRESLVGNSATEAVSTMLLLCLWGCCCGVVLRLWWNGHSGEIWLRTSKGKADDNQ